MQRFVPLALVFLLAAACVAQQDQPPKVDPDKPENVKKWKKLPTGWSKELKLDAKQKEAMYKVKREFFPKTYNLEQQLAKFHTEERQALLKLLTDDQKKKLAGVPEPPPAK